MNPKTVDESFALLHAAGWSIGDVRLFTPTGERWLVTGSRGKHILSAQATSQSDAWEEALHLAKASEAGDAEPTIR